MNATCKAHAKINLGLYVLSKRPDGFHDIKTVFHRIHLHDQIGFEPSSRIEVVSNSADAPGGEANLCHRAAVLLREHFGVKTGVRIMVDKRIPVGAGLGGGSSDAATVLRHLPRFWGQEIDFTTAAQMALQLGSDVPYFLRDGSALATGRGEVLEYFDLRIRFHIVVCHPGIHIPTAWAYAHVTPKPEGRDIDLKQLLLEGMANPSLLVEYLTNDFEELVFAHYPAVAEVKSIMLERGAVYAAMSGSGSSVFGMFGEEREARAAQATLKAKGYDPSLA